MAAPCVTRPTSEDGQFLGKCSYAKFKSDIIKSYTSCTDALGWYQSSKVLYSFVTRGTPPYKRTNLKYQ